MKSGAKRRTNWNKYQSKKIQRQNHYLDYFIYLDFQGINRVSLLSCEDNI